MASKPPLTIIGKSKRPRSFPRHIHSQADNKMFYYVQENSWNSKGIWKAISLGLNKMARLSGLKFKSVLEDCWAHLIDSIDHGSFSPVFFPPNLTVVGYLSQGKLIPRVRLRK